MGKKIIIAGGGTGGHIFPAIAIANALKAMEPDTNILFIGASGKMEMEKVPQAGYEIKGLDITGFNRSSLIKNVGLPFKIVKSFFQVRSIFISYMPDAVIGVGGYSTYPVLRYAQARGIPTFIHEANSFAGKSNMLLGKKADKIFVANEGMEKFFPAEKIMISGNPVRSSIVRDQISREEALRFFGLGPDKKTVLSVGGSLGAKSINEAIEQNIDVFGKEAIQLIWQTGKLFVEDAKKAAAGKKNVWTNDFINKMEYAYAAADVVISRAGAMTIAELCVVGKPVVFVPFPHAAENHQEVNAMQLVNKGAGIMIHDRDAGKQLINRVIELVKDESKQAAMKEQISKLAITDADVVVAREIMNAIKNK